MRLIHWCNFPSSTAVSGLLTSVKEMVEAELEMGIDAGICDAGKPEEAKGGKEIKLRRQTIKTKPWSWAYENQDCVSIMSTGQHEVFHKLPHKIAILHGMPIHCVHVEIYQRRNAFGTSMNLPRASDYAVAWSQLEADMWGCFSDNVSFIERGVDLEFWAPDGEKGPERRFHPQVLFLEVQRPVKWPLTFLLALKHLSKRPGMENLRVQFGSVEGRSQLLWMQIIAKLDLDTMIQDYIVGVHSKPWTYYRSADIVVSPCQGGLLSRVGAEALACGAPVIMLEGSPEKKATLKCKDTPLDMAEAIETVWGKVQKDPKGMRRRARKIAEKHYDIKDTVKGFLELADTLV